MIVKKEWDSKEQIEVANLFTGTKMEAKYHYTGWFLLGIIPLYIVRE